MINNSLIIDYGECKHNNLNKKEKLKQERNRRVVEELDNYGYSYLQNKPKLLKFWKKRHLLFSKFEKGILLDEGIFIRINGN